MAYLIIIAGLPATGKSVFAKYLCEKMKIPMASKDSIKECLFDNIGFKSRQEKVALGTAAMNLLYHFAELNLEAGRPVILENNFENDSKPGLIKLIEKYRCKSVMVRFHTELNVLYERLSERDKSPDRHRGHVVNTCYPENDNVPAVTVETMGFDNFYTGMKKRGMDNFSIGCEEIIVDSTDFSKVDYDEIYGKVIRGLDLKNRLED